MGKKTLLRIKQTFPNTEPDPGTSAVFQSITQDSQETREGGQGEQAQRRAWSVSPGGPGAAGLGFRFAAPSSVSD